MGVEEVETSLPLGSCPTEIDEGTTGRGGEQLALRTPSGWAPIQMAQGGL